MTTPHPQIRIRRIYEPAEPGDGARVLVDRLWPRGMRKEDAGLTLWLKEAAPSTGLRQWFHHDPTRYAEFVKRYRGELAQQGAALAQLAALTRQGPVTLLYAARDEAHNHAQVLADCLRHHMAGHHGP